MTSRGDHSAGFHNLRPVRRSLGQSSVHSGAYIARTAWTDARTGERRSYVRRGGLAAPVEVIGWEGSAESLCQACEASERRKDAQTARTSVLALPAELTDAERVRLVRGYALHLRDRYGVAVLVAIHQPEPGPDKRPGLNHHAHLLESVRRVDPAGRHGLGEKVREMDDRRGTGPQEVEHRRAEWARRINAALTRKERERAREAGERGEPAPEPLGRVDHRSLARRARAEGGQEAAVSEPESPSPIKGSRRARRRGLGGAGTRLEQAQRAAGRHAQNLLEAAIRAAEQGAER